MRPGGLVRWQWDGYASYHRSRANLLMHIVLVPAFLIGNVALVYGAVRGSLVTAALGLGAMMVSMALQGRGHKGEQNPPVPFASPVEALSRIFLEQWVTFPRFVLTGGWRRALERR